MKSQKNIAIYGASRASIPERSIMWKQMIVEGANIVCSWINESGPEETQDFSELWSRIQAEINSCGRLVLYVENGDLPLKGALVEVGMALALGKPVWIVCKDIILTKRDLKPLGSWANHPLITFCADIRKACDVH
jgi:hypothetical protein